LDINGAELKKEVKMIEKIFPGILPLGPGGPEDPPQCYCVCGCTPQDPKKDDSDDDYEDEG
jgi:hypothetical protein